MTIDKVRAELMLLEDRKNAKRSSSITPNAKPVLGARLPDLRRLAKQIAKKDYRAFLEQCPDDFLNGRFYRRLYWDMQRMISKLFWGMQISSSQRLGTGVSMTAFASHFRLHAKTAHMCGNG